MKKSLTVCLIIVMVIAIIFPTICLADINTGAYKNLYKDPDSTSDSNIGKTAGKVLGAIQVLGIGIAVIMLIIIAVRYIIASTQEKAQLKDRLVPYVIGAVLLFAGSSIMTIIAKWVYNFS